MSIKCQLFVSFLFYRKMKIFSQCFIYYFLLHLIQESIKKGSLFYGIYRPSGRFWVYIPRIPSKMGTINPAYMLEVPELTPLGLGPSEQLGLCSKVPQMTKLLILSLVGANANPDYRLLQCILKVMT